MQSIYTQFTKFKRGHKIGMHESEHSSHEMTDRARCNTRSNLVMKGMGRRVQDELNLWTLSTQCDDRTERLSSHLCGRGWAYSVLLCVGTALEYAYRCIV